MANFGVDIIASPINETYLTTLLLFEPPTKRTYLNGEYFNPAGMIVQAIYNNNTRKNLTTADYTYTPSGALTDSDTAVTISYTEGDITKTLSVAITVAATLTGIEITTMPVKTVYDYNEQPDYNGMLVSATYSNGTSMPITTWLAPTIPLTTLGSVGLTVSYTENGVTYTADVPVTVQPKVIENVPSQNGTLTYTGSALSPTWEDYDSDELTIGGANTGANAGEYEATFTPKYGYCWTDTTSTAKTVMWEILRAHIENIPTQSGTLTYNGSPLTPTWNNYNPTQLAMGGDTSATNAGEYTVTFTPTDNYCWSDGTTEGKQATWTIEKATLEVPTQQGILTYNGETLTPVWDNSSINFCDVEGTQSSVDAGSFTLTLTPQANFEWADGTSEAKDVTWSIGRAVLQVPQQSGALTYNTEEQEPTLSNNSASYCTVGGTSAATNAGTYTMTLTPNSNYEWSDNSTGAKDILWVIGKATGTLTLSTYTVNLTSDNPTATVTWTTNSNGNVAITGSTDIYEAGIGEAIYFTGLATGSGTVYVSLEETANYTGVDDLTIEVNVEMKASRLPKGYTEVEYIENPNFGYNKTIPVLNTKTSKIEVVISEDISGATSSTTTMAILGYSNLTATKRPGLFLIYRNSGNSSHPNEFQLGYYDSNNLTRYTYLPKNSMLITDGKLYISIKYSTSNLYELTINDSIQTSAYSTAAGCTSIGIFGYYSISTTTSNMTNQANFKLYSLRNINISDNSTAHDYVPCLNSNGEAGLYDIVQDVFYKSEASSKPYVAGPTV